MRIACAQFSPQVGDADNNLNRADAVLNKALPEHFESLDLLVLPELAFTGFNFESLQQIYPFLEPSGSGISSLWARTTALKYCTNVLVGYPEKVDVRDKWPTSPEYYNSAIMVNDEGDTVFNYRKNFLDPADQRWALECGEGFFNHEIPGLGKVCVALGADINSDGSLHSFDFAWHALDVEADVLIVCMSWVTRKDSQEFTCTLGEPDMETLTHWVHRLEPLVRAELDREVIVVFCNRSGQEGESLYAGTSAVVGIKGGEVSVYALAGRGTKEVLFIDTSDGPFAKLVQADDEDPLPKQIAEMLEVEESPKFSSRSVDQPRWTSDASRRQPSPLIAGVPPSTKGQAPNDETMPQPTDRYTVKPLPDRKERQAPVLGKLDIPQQGEHSHQPQSSQAQSQSPTILPTPTIPTPTAPSPTPMTSRPKIVVPDYSVASVGLNRESTPFPHDKYFHEQRRFFGDRVQGHTPSPVSPAGEPHLPIVPPTQSSTSFYWRPSDTLLKTPANFDLLFADTPDHEPPSINHRGATLAPLTPFPGEEIPFGLRGPLYATQINNSLKFPTSIERTETLSPSFSIASPLVEAAGRFVTGISTNPARSQQQGIAPRRPSVPTSRSDSRPKDYGTTATSAGTRGLGIVNKDAEDYNHRRNASTVENRAAWLAQAFDSSATPRAHPSKTPLSSRKERIRDDSGSRSRVDSLNQTSLLQRALMSPEARFSEARPSSSSGHVEQSESRGAPTRVNSRPRGVSPVRLAQSGSADPIPVVTARGHSIETVMQPGSSRGPPKVARSISRGRQGWTGGVSPPRADSKHSSISVRQNSEDTVLITRRVGVTRIHSSSKPAGVRNATPDDDIVAVEEYVNPSCEQHSRAQSANPPHKMPSVEDGRAILGAHCNLPPPPPVSHLDEDEDWQAQNPAVLGGSVKTTIITVPDGASGNSLTSPLPSANSVVSATSMSSITSQASQTTETPNATPTSRNTTPDNMRIHTHGFIPLMASRLVDEKRADTPLLAVCDHCGSPRTGNYLGEEAKRATSLW